MKWHLMILARDINLHNLSALNVDILKIDKLCFISTGLSAQHLVTSIAGTYYWRWYKAGTLKTIAEGGNEGANRMWLLWKRGVQYCQGWYFAKALPPQEFMHWIQRSPAILTQSGQ